MTASGPLGWILTLALLCVVLATPCAARDSRTVTRVGVYSPDALEALAAADWGAVSERLTPAQPTQPSPRAIPEFGRPGLDGLPRTVLEHDGRLYVGGAIHRLDGIPVQGLAVWDGTSWSDGGLPRLEAGGSVSALAAWDGELVVGGAGIGGAGHGVFRLRGTHWEPLGTLTPVTALTVWNGDLHAVSGAGVHRWNGVDWLAVGLSDGTLHDLEVYEGTLVLAGDFDAIDGTPAHDVARFQGTWTSLTSEGFDVAIELSLAVHRGDLLVGGFFHEVDGLPVNGMARYTSSGWQEVDGVPFPFIHDLQVEAGVLTVASTRGVAVLEDGAWQAQPVEESPEVPGMVTALGAWRGDPVAVGRFSRVDDRAAWDVSVRTDAWGALGPVQQRGLNGPVHRLAVYRGSLVAAGRFSVAGNRPAGGLARLDPDGWVSLSRELEGTVHVLTEYHGELYAGGDFRRLDAQGRSYLARWDGTEWRGVGTRIAGVVYDAAVHRGELWVAGEDLFGDGAVSLARWNGYTWAAVSGVSGAVYAVHDHGEDLLVGGALLVDRVPGPSAVFGRDGWRAVASGAAAVVDFVDTEDGWMALHASRSGRGFGITRETGVVWGASILDPFGGTPSVGHALLAVGERTLLLGGFGSGQANGIAVTSPGDSWSAFDIGILETPGATAHHGLVVDGRLYVAGRFEGAGGVPAQNLAAWDVASVAVRLTSFTAVRRGDDVTLEWVVTDPDQVAGFALLRDDGAGYRPVSGGSLPVTARSHTDRSSGTAANYALDAIQRDGTVLRLGTVRVTAGSGMAIHSVYPNPLRASTNIRFSGPAGEVARVDVFDLRGRRVATPWRGRTDEGVRQVWWDGLDQAGRTVAAGVFLIRVTAGTESRSAKVVVVR